jgi:hypothetical protein
LQCIQKSQALFSSSPAKILAAPRIVSEITSPIADAASAENRLQLLTKLNKQSERNQTITAEEIVQAAHAGGETLGDAG